MALTLYIYSLCLFSYKAWLYYSGAGGLGGGNFWTGAGVGGLLGYMMGNRNNTGIL